MNEFFGQLVDSAVIEKIRRHERTGRPLGSDKFVLKLEGILDRILSKKKAGRPKKKLESKNERKISMVSPDLDFRFTDFKEGI